MTERRVRELMAQWRTLRFGLSEEDAAEAWAESMAIHEDTCPAVNPTDEAVRLTAMTIARDASVVEADRLRAALKRGLANVDIDGSLRIHDLCSVEECWVAQARAAIGGSG
jgi:hypothetical protein